MARFESNYALTMRQASAAALEIGEASAVTLSRRIPLLFSVPFWPQFDSLIEVHRMLTEKAAAAAEGSVGALRETASLATETVLGRIDAIGLATTPMRIVMAACRPMHRRARANACRLLAEEGR